MGIRLSGHRGEWVSRYLVTEVSGYQGIWSQGVLISGDKVRGYISGYRRVGLSKYQGIRHLDRICE